MLDAILSMLAPHLCLSCNVAGSVWCAACRQAAPSSVSRCYRCHRLTESGRTCVACRAASPLFGIVAATRYEGSAKQLIWGLKFSRLRAGAAIAADMIATRCSLPAGATLTYVPTSTGHVRQRGFDQAQLIARRVARQTDFPYRPLLLRLGQQQQHTASRRQRMAQLAGAFRVPNATLVQGKHIVLVDDVITTGATLEAAARALKAAGAKRVSAVTFAQA